MQRDGKIVDNLLTHCPLAQKMVFVSIYFWDSLGIFPKSVMQLLTSWQAKFVGMGIRKLGKRDPSCIALAFWPERKRRTF